MGLDPLGRIRIGGPVRPAQILGLLPELLDTGMGGQLPGNGTTPSTLRLRSAFYRLERSCYVGLSSEGRLGLSRGLAAPFQSVTWKVTQPVEKVNQAGEAGFDSEATFAHGVLNPCW